MKIDLQLDFEELTEKLREFKQLEEGDGNITDHLHTQEGDGVTIRAFPSGEKGNYEEYPVTRIEMEVKVKSDADWYDNFTEYGAYGDNIRNSNSPIYDSLADQLEESIEDAGFSNPALVAERGSITFTETLKL